MKRTPLVSVIIPFYNEEKYLSKSISSLLAQTYPKLEIIAIDDGSTDNSYEVVKKLKIKTVRQKHAGPGRARNKGARLAKGSILVFPDADMRYDPKYIEKLVNPIIEKKAIGTFNKIEYVANSSQLWSRCWAINAGLSFNRRSPQNLPSKLDLFRAIKKSAFVKSGGYDFQKGYFDDTTISVKLGIKAVSAPGAIAYHFNPESLPEVFVSARWIGRGMQHKKKLHSAFAYSPVNSIKHSLKNISQGAPKEFLIFKLVFDFGIFLGIFFSFGKKEK